MYIHLNLYVSKKTTFSHVYRTELLVNSGLSPPWAFQDLWPSSTTEHGCPSWCPRGQHIVRATLPLHFQLSVLLDLLIILLIDGGFPWSWGFRCGVHMLLAIQLQDAENAVAWWIANDYNDWDIDWNRSYYSITFRSVKCLPKQL